MVVTADCDIAQDKAGDSFSLLRIITAEQYIREVWSRAELARLVEKRSATALQVINSALERLGGHLDPLNEMSLKRWLVDREPSEIIGAVGLSNKAVVDECSRDLWCLRDLISAERGEPAFQALSRAWRRLATSDKTIRGRLSDVLNPSRGPGDVYFIPYLPEFDDIGFVISLRLVVSVPQDRVFRSRVSARVSGVPNSYYRVGRFRDAIKYSIVQRMAALFSRIGLSEEYELESTTAAELVIENVLHTARETTDES